MIQLKRILLVENNPNDAELILTALTNSHLGNEVMGRDGEEALDYLHYRGILGAVINPLLPEVFPATNCHKTGG